MVSNSPPTGNALLDQSIDGSVVEMPEYEPVVDVMVVSWPQEAGGK